MTPSIYLPTLPGIDRLEKGVYKRLGYPAKDQISTDMQRAIQSALERARLLSSAKVVYQYMPITSVSYEHIFAKHLVIPSRLWAGFMGKVAGHRGIICFALTLGERLDLEIAKDRPESLSTAFLLDAVGSELIETLADDLARFYATLPEVGARFQSRRFSPGYCDWPLDRNRALFQFLNPIQVGIQIADSGALKPIKSITAAILFADVMPTDCPCALCKNRTCNNRGVCKVPAKYGMRPAKQ